MTHPVLGRPCEGHRHGHHHVGAHLHHHVGAPVPHHGAHLGEATATVDHGRPDWTVAVTVTISSSLWAGTLA